MEPSTAQPSRSAPAAPTRATLTPAGWPGAVNAWQVRPGLWRMGRAEWLTGPGWEALAAAGVRAVVDLRLPQEVRRRETDPDETPTPDGIRRVHTPIEDAEDERFRALIGGLETPYVNHPRLYAESMRLFPRLVGAALTETLDAWTEGGAILHCSAGRDRTGLITALLLQLPDIPGGAADWEEQAAVYAAGVRGINEHHRTSGLRHPYESHVAPADLEAGLEDRLTALADFLTRWPADRVAELLAADRSSSR